jgi:hypothetical protein
MGSAETLYGSAAQQERPGMPGSTRWPLIAVLGVGIVVVVGGLLGLYFGPFREYGKLDMAAFWAGIWSGVVAGTIVGLFLAVVVGFAVWWLQSGVQAAGQAADLADRHAREARRELHSIRSEIRRMVGRGLLARWSTAQPQGGVMELWSYDDISVRLTPLLEATAVEHWRELCDEAAGGRYPRYAGDTCAFAEAALAFIPANRAANDASQPLRVALGHAQEVVHATYPPGLSLSPFPYLVVRAQVEPPRLYDAIIKAGHEGALFRDQHDALEAYWGEAASDPDVRQALEHYRAALAHVRPAFERLLRTLQEETR